MSYFSKNPSTSRICCGGYVYSREYYAYWLHTEQCLCAGLEQIIGKTNKRGLWPSCSTIYINIHFIRWLRVLHFILSVLQAWNYKDGITLRLHVHVDNLLADQWNCLAGRNLAGSCICKVACLVSKELTVDLHLLPRVPAAWKQRNRTAAMISQ